MYKNIPLFNNGLIVIWAVYTPTALSYECIYPIAVNMVLNIAATAVCSESSMIWDPMIAEYSTYVKTNTHCYFVCKNADKANAYNRTLNAIIIAI